MKFYIIFTLVVCSFLTVHAGPSVDPIIRLDGPGGSMENEPVIDQRELPICFAAAASQYLSAVQRKSKVKHPIRPSAIALAAGVAIQKGYNSFKRGGDPCAAVSYARNHGVCSVDKIENKNEDPSGKLAEGLNSRISLGEEFKQSYDTLNQSGTDPRLARPCYTTNPVIQETIPDTGVMNMLMNQACDLGPTLKKITENCAPVPPVKKNPNPLENLSVSCSQFPGAKEAGRIVSPAEYEEKLNALLKQNNPLPIMAGICSEFLMSEQGRASNPKDHCKPHAVLIVGVDPKSHRFLIRNSWGTDCDHYRSDLQKHCEPGKGNVWIDANELTKHMLGIMT